LRRIRFFLIPDRTLLRDSTPHANFPPGVHQTRSPLQLTEIPCEIQRCPESYSCEGGASRRGVLGRVRKTTPFGHPKQGIQCEQNQSLATCVEVGFLGNLGLLVDSTLRLPDFLEPAFRPVSSGSIPSQLQSGPALSNARRSTMLTRTFLMKARLTRQAMKRHSPVLAKWTFMPTDTRWIACCQAAIT